MKERFWKFIVVLGFFLPGRLLHAQWMAAGVPGTSSITYSLPGVTRQMLFNVSAEPLSLTGSRISKFATRLTGTTAGTTDRDFYSTALFSLPVPTSTVASQSLMVPASGFYVKHLAFFCRQELHLEQYSRIPLRFRFGSLEQFNQLEGK